MKRDQAECTAILAWGSLVGEPNDTFDKDHEAWRHDGPILPIEFSRISSCRKGALTLVIDPDSGVLTRTWYALSRRTDPQDAACDLRTREGTVMRNIGLFDTRGNIARSRWTLVTDKVKAWLEAKGFIAAVWTDLPSNYTETRRELYSADAAVNYIAGLSPEGKAAARHYLAVVPYEVRTPFRIAVENAEWIRDEPASA